MKNIFIILLTVTTVLTCFTPVQRAFANDGNPVAITINENDQDEAAVSGAEPVTQIIDSEPDKQAAIAAEPEPLRETIPYEPPPLVSFGSWALVNLILTIATGLLAAALLAVWLRGLIREGAGRRPARAVRKQTALSIMSVMATVISVMVFSETENMSRARMVLTDAWTIWHIAITIATVALVLLYIKERKGGGYKAKQA